MHLRYQPIKMHCTANVSPGGEVEKRRVANQPQWRGQAGVTRGYQQGLPGAQGLPGTIDKTSHKVSVTSTLSPLLSPPLPWATARSILDPSPPLPFLPQYSSAAWHLQLCPGPNSPQLTCNAVSATMPLHWLVSPPASPSKTVQCAPTSSSQF